MKDDTIQEAAKQVGELIKKHKPYLFTIDEEVEKVSNGIIKLEIRVYERFVTDVVLHSSIRKVYKKLTIIDKKT